MSLKREKETLKRIKSYLRNGWHFHFLSTFAPALIFELNFYQKCHSCLLGLYRSKKDINETFWNWIKIKYNTNSILSQIKPTNLKETALQGTWTRTWPQTQNKAQWLAACRHVSASSQSLRFILSLRMNSSFITLNMSASSKLLRFILSLRLNSSFKTSRPGWTTWELQ